MNTNNNNEQIFYNAKTNLERAGFKVETISIANASFTANENHTKYTAEISLPQGKTLEDYCSVLLWSVVEDDTGYASLPMSANFVADDENNIPGNQTVKLYTLNQKNYIEFYMSNEAMSKDYLESMITNWTELMLISTPLRVFNQTNTVITYSLAGFFTQERLGFDFSDKSYLITLDYQSDEEIECYSLTPREPTSSGDTIINDGDNYYTESSDINAEHHKDYFKFKILRVEQFGVVGYTQEELDSMTEAEKDNIAKFNAAALNKASDFCAKMAKKFLRIMNLSFKPNRIYLLGSVVYFSSDTNFLGNNAVIKLFKNTNNVADVIVAFSNKKIVNIDDDYGNVGFYDLIIEGRYGNSVSIADQAIKCNGDSSKTIPKNVTFVNVTAKDFAFGIHINNSTYYNIPLYWTFINCDFKTGMGFNLTGVKSLKLLNSHIDNCLSTDKFNHCIYISEKCSYLTVDNCLLENSAGGAIHQNYGHELKNSEFNHNNTFKNITIRSCQTGLNIGLTSKSINAENIYMYDVLRGIILNSCVDVEIKNIYATGSFYRRPRNYANGRERVFNSHIKLYESTENGLPVSDDAWTAIGIKGKVKAKISNGYFKFSSPTIGSSAYLTTDINGGNNGAREIDYVYEQHKDWFEDDFVEANVVFENCAFDSTYNNLYKSYKKENGIISSYCTSERSNSYVGVSVAQKITSNPNLEITYKNNIKFIRCKFEMNYDTVSKVFFYFKGNPKSVSTYSFESCNIFLYIEDYIAQQNKKLFGAYFSYAGKGANISLVNCNFRKNCLLYKALGNPKTECQYWANGDGETIISNCTEALFDYQLDDFPN